MRTSWLLAAAIVAPPIAGCATSQTAGPDWRLGLPSCWVDPYNPPCFNGERAGDSREIRGSLKYSAEARRRVADLNARPIFIRAIGDRTAVSALYVVGHAELACCKEISSILHEASQVHGLAEDWVSFGVGRLGATSGKAQRELASAVRRIEKAQQSACAGQVDLALRPDDHPKALAENIRRASQATREKSNSLGRPVLAWHELADDDFVFAPMLVADSSGQLQPLAIELPIKQFDYPQKVYTDVALTGLDAYIASLRRAIADTHHLAQLQSTSTNFTRFAKRIEVTSWRGEVDPGNRVIHTDITTASATLSQLIDTLKSADRYIDGVDLSAPRQWLADNNASLQAMDRGTSLKPGRLTWHIVNTVQYTPLHELERQHAEAQRTLPDLEAELAHALRSRVRPPGDPLPALADASLRGWPASMISPEGEQAFDRWQGANQPKLWGSVVDLLRAGGLIPRTERDPLTRFRSSSLVFQIERREQTLVIRPTYILAGGFYVVTDPGTRIIRYEAAISDQNRIQ